jgi:N-acetylmuramic acid 6-phosphate etherase
VIPPTERRNPRTTRIDELTADRIVALMNEEEHDALRAVEAATTEISEASQRAAAAFAAGGRVVYLGAGTSGHIAAMDALEIAATFGVEPGRFRALIAAGGAASARVADSEDDPDAVVRALDEMQIGSPDMVIGVAASGSTPFVVAGVAHARARGAFTCGVANNPCTPLLGASDLPLLLDTGPEVITGSTRLKAGTAQKLALNRISTTAMVLAGRVISNLMVDVRPATDKLRARCVRIVQELVSVDEARARYRLERTDWSVRAALNLTDMDEGP